MLICFMSLVLFLQELRLDLPEAGFPFYIDKDKGLAGASVEDVAVHAFAPRELVEFVPAMFFVQYCLLCIRLHEGFYALLF